MTLRAKPVTKRARSTALGGRRTLLTNLAFGLVVVLAVLILVAAAGASWYGDHFGSVAVVNGKTITRDQFRDQYSIEAFRLSQASARIRNEFQSGHLTETEEQQQLSQIQQLSDSSNLQQQSYEDLIDQLVMGTLASQQGVTVTDADVDAQIKTEATTPELRHVEMIAVTPEISSGASDPTDAQKAAAKAKADAALKDLQSGKKWEDVTKATSTDTATAATGGDLGWLLATDSSQDQPFLQAVFAAQLNTPTAVVTGADGTYRIGRATEVQAPQVDSAWTQKVTDAGIDLNTYRQSVRAEVVGNKLRDKIVSSVVDQATDQKKVSEIYIPLRTDGGTGDEVHVRHILYSPNDLTDQTQVQAIPTTDPAWQKAKDKAQAAYDKLKAYASDPTELEKQFTDLANAETDDPSGKTTGGDLPYLTRDSLDPQFGDAVFKGGLKKDDLIGPIQSSFGWHVILWEDLRPNPEGRINAAKLDASASGANFADVVKKWSEGPNVSGGGDIGWVAKYQLSQQLEDAIFKTPVNAISDIVDVSGDGFYLFKVTDEQTRKPDGDQAETLKSSAFGNWYQPLKNDTTKFTIDRQLTFSTAPTQ